MNRADFEGRNKARYWSAVRFAQVQSAKRERARRAKHLPSELLAEPAWDILLELYSFKLIGRPVSESELAEKVTVPTTVSVRWMKMLESQNLIARAVDQNNATQVTVDLTPDGLEAMEGYFSDEG